ncbi:hypothetical protein BV898_17151 [Hypsibius exemplaris]|uniref:Uncharacterized protein n=1 Tax=Hypsibius exemplaris TaxID=2072580 RepID=A0A9X6NF22_HYPEX|nr:hypothetical protein BV898_17151 [Hypsibius exemplaris]
MNPRTQTAAFFMKVLMLYSLVLLVADAEGNSTVYPIDRDAIPAGRAQNATKEHPNQFNIAGLTAEGRRTVEFAKFPGGPGRK